MKEVNIKEKNQLRNQATKQYAVYAILEGQCGRKRTNIPFNILDEMLNECWMIVCGVIQHSSYILSPGYL